MWNGKYKAVTLSYDDGVVQDLKMARILNKYGIKCTFNICSGFFWNENNPDYKDKSGNYASLNEIKQGLSGHELAVHSCTHPGLTNCTDEQLYREVGEDKRIIEKAFDIKVNGMAYPFGNYDERVMQTVANCGLHYARTVESSHNFFLPTNSLAWNPTCHHSDEKLDELINEFLTKEASSQNPMLLYIWGHSWEFDGSDHGWQHLEDICKKLSGREEIFYGTNAQVLNLSEDTL